MSSLAQQLQAITAKTASVALDRKARSKVHLRSLIFDPKTAAGQDYDFLFQVGREGLEELIEIDSRFAKFNNTLFSETTVNFDRNVQTKDVLELMDKNITAFLTLVGPYYQLGPALKAVEWLVRRFYANVHNQEMLLLLALPHHAKPVFVKVLNVIPAKGLPQIFEWLSGYKEQLRSPPSALLVKAFRNDNALLRLYTACVVDAIANSTVYKEQLVFYLLVAVPVMAAFAKDPVALNDVVLPPVLEAVGALLQPASDAQLRYSSTLHHDVRLTAYALIAVASSVAPLTMALVEAFTAAVLHDNACWHASTRKQTVVVLGRIWSGVHVDEVADWTAVTKAFGNLNVLLLTSDSVLSEVTADGHRVDVFLTAVLVACAERDVSAYGLVSRIGSKTAFIAGKLLQAGPEARDAVIAAFETFSKEELVVALKNHGKVVADLEMLLMHSFGADENEELVESTIPEATETLIEESVPTSFDQLASEIASFFDTLATETFTKLYQTLLAALRDVPAAQQPPLVAKFTKQALSEASSAVSFHLRLALTNSAPLLARLLALKEAHDQIEAVQDEIYLILPVLLAGLHDQSRAIRMGFSELLHSVKKATEKSKKRKLPVLFMEDALYGSTPASSRHLIAPADAVLVVKDLNDSLVADVVHDRERLPRVVFDGLFVLSTKKKLGLVARTFILSQWAQTQWPLAIKSRVWAIVGDENARTGGTDDRFFFEGDVSTYVSKREMWKTEAAAARLDFEASEAHLVSLVGGKASNDKASQKEADWLLKALQQPNGLQIAADKRISEVFSLLRPVDSRVKLASELVDLLVADVDVQIDPLALLQNLQVDHSAVLALILGVQIVSQVPEQGVAKRRRRLLSSTKQNMAREDISAMASSHLRRLTIILDVLEHGLRHQAPQLARSDVLQALFRLLTDLDYLGNDGHLPVLYAQETLASCMLLAVVALKEAPERVNLDSNSIRADLIVNLIRQLASPQAQNRLLLVVAELAALAPEMVLHLVMPIFTFMGAHTVRQDDEFSSLALQQTIAKVVPALAANGTLSLDREIEFLLTSFVAAFHHIPRHRRVRLFHLLTTTLGHGRLLHVIVFLVGLQHVRAVQKHRTADAAALVDFSVALLRHFAAHEVLDGLAGFYDLWTSIPASQLDPQSPEWSELAGRLVFGLAVALLSTDELLQTKAGLASFVDTVLETDLESVLALRVKVLAVLLDEQADETSREAVLSEFSRLTALVLASLDVFSGHDELLTALYALLASFLSLLPLAHFVDAVNDLMGDLLDPVLVRVARNFAILVATKVDAEVSGTSADSGLEEAVLSRLVPTLVAGVRLCDNLELVQAYLDAFSVVVTKFAVPARQSAAHTAVLLDATTVATGPEGLLGLLPEVVIASIAAITSVVNVLGVKTIGLFPRILAPALKVWEATENDDAGRLVQAAVLALVACLVKKLPAFVLLSLDKIVATIVHSELLDLSVRLLVLDLVVAHLDTALVLKTVCNLGLEDSIYKTDSATALGLYLHVTQQTIEKADKRTATANATLFMRWLVRLFEFPHDAEGRFNENTVRRLESLVHGCAIAYVMKLNDKTFRPLFSSLVRWAVSGEGATSLSSTTEASRLDAFFRFFNKLQEQLKSIVTLYYSYLLEAVAGLLSRFASRELEDINIRRLVLILLNASFRNDQDDYWLQQPRFELVVDPLLAQLTSIEEPIGKYLVRGITSFVSNVSSEEYNEKLVNGLVRYISNEHANTPQTKIWTIRCLKSIFQKMGEQWLSYLPTLIPYIAELLEDDDEEVEMEVRSGLVKVIENVLGEPLDRYLE